jgi:anti-anti-sigma regulatory factor
VLPVGLEAVLLALLTLHLNYRGPAASGLVLYEASGLASLAMGLQNATITKISGAVVRTTHLTGIFTDLGLEGVQYLFWWGDRLAKRRRERAGRLLRISRRHPSALRLLLLLSIAGSFGFGTVVGTLVYSRWASLALIGPIAFLMWIVYVDWRTPIADIRELDLLNDPELRLQGIISKLLPAEVILYRASCLRGGAAHRAPNFQLWIDRVPEHCRVLVLAVSPLTRFDANAVMDLEAAVAKLHREKRKLILSGITTRQFKALDALGVARMMDINNLCPDLEFAIARAIVVLEDMRPRPVRRPQPVLA